MVNALQGVHTSLGEEVLVAVVHDTYTRHGLGGAVFLPGAGLAQPLVGDAAGTVGTQWALSAAVHASQMGHPAVPLVTVIRAAGLGDVVALVGTQADVRQYIGGQEVTDAATNRGAMIQVAHTVCQVAVRESLNLNRASALSHYRKR